MAAGHVRKLSEKRWIARFPLGGRGRFRSRTFDRKRDAEAWLESQRQRRDRGDWVDPAHSAESFQAVAESWLSSRRDVATSTRARDDSYLRNQVLPHLGPLQLRHVTPEVLDEWVERLDEDLAPATVRKAFQIASSVLDRAVVLRKIPANPARVAEGISLPAMGRTEMRFLDVDEVQDLATSIDPWYRSLVLTAAYTGARWGELVGLRAKYLDLDGGRVTIAETMAEVGGAFEWKDPKTPASRRTIALPGSLVVALRDHLASRPAVGGGLVFTAPGGHPIRRSNFRRRIWLPAVRASVGTPCRFHDLRHTHAAWLIANGEHPKTIQSRLGHSSISTTLDRYGHLMEGLDTAAAGRLDELAGGAGKHPGSTRDRSPITDLSGRKKKTPGGP